MPLCSYLDTMSRCLHTGAEKFLHREIAQCPRFQLPGVLRSTQQGSVFKVACMFWSALGPHLNCAFAVKTKLDAVPLFEWHSVD